MAETPEVRRGFTFLTYFFQKFVLDHANSQMYQSHKTLHLRREMSLPLTFIRPFRDNPQSCRLNYQRVHAVSALQTSVEMLRKENLGRSTRGPADPPAPPAPPPPCGAPAAAGHALGGGGSCCRWSSGEASWHTNGMPRCWTLLPSWYPVDASLA